MMRNVERSFSRVKRRFCAAPRTAFAPVSEEKRRYGGQWKKCRRKAEEMRKKDAA
ncbi:hypothetical protein [Paraburkholderia bannensis]|uniref:hypothetical protein n=1 Tax=Paraburkholderia bannensis TaxID=765414 RepID=UPI002AC31BF4|nr:hypothetical protein [Paraburkholderia bannensis]